MKLKKFLTIAAIFFTTVFLIFLGEKPDNFTGKKVIVLGFDGLDPKTVQRLVNQGNLPNFSELINKGSFSNLATTTPPQSPVAWASFITGNNPGKHNVFDFLTRDPESYMPKLTISEIRSPGKLDIGSYSIPMGTPEVIAYRQGVPFWSYLEKEEIPATVLLVPVTYPPDEGKSKILSGMGVPDLLGTNGTFSFYTTHREEEKKVTGGKVFFVDKYYDLIEAELFGPNNDFEKNGKPVSIPFTAEILEEGGAKFKIQNQEFTLSDGQWSQWVPVEFSMPPFANLKGIVRFNLVSSSPAFSLYVSPINLDPKSPGLPISNPPEYSKYLAERFGNFYTQGMPEDTWALNEHRLDDTAFLDLTHFIQKSRVEIFKEELRNLKRGLLASVFVSPDRVQHMFTRYIDPKSPLHADANDMEHKGAIDDVYLYCDKILGDAMKYLDEQTTLIVISDHGFSYFRRSVHLNTWLIENGYMALKDPNLKVGEEFFENVDWSKTKAFALGLNGIYLNVKNREKNGIVDSENEMEKLKKEISEKLILLKDSKSNQPVVLRVYDSKKIYSGHYRKNAPDLVVGYNHGYRTSWQTAMGGAPGSTFEDNLKKWSGDHLIDPQLVPGILVSNKSLKNNNPGIMDLAPTILAEFGLDLEKNFDGKKIF